MSKPTPLDFSILLNNMTPSLTRSIASRNRKEIMQTIGDIYNILATMTALMGLDLGECIDLSLEQDIH